MKARRKPAPEKIEVTIDKLVYGAFGLGRHGGKVVFVPFTAPGDRVEVQIVQQKKNFIRARVVKLLQAGAGRQSPPCPHFGSCGGCQWQHLQYPVQLEAKRAVLEELFHHRFPETRDLSIEMRASPEPFGYRARARIQLRGFGAETRAGFFQFQSHTVEDVEACPLLRPVLNQGLAAVRSERREGKSDPSITAVDLICSQEEGKWAAAPAEDDAEAGENFSAARGGAAQPAPVLEREIAGIRYSVSPSVFFQVNDYLLEPLVRLVQDLAQGTGRSAALDLFSGVGLFALPLSLQFGRVVAVEASEQAARFCRQNSVTAGRENIEVVCAEVEAWMAAVGSVAPPAFDLVLLDPPRAGAGPAVMQHLIQWCPETVIYVACDPQTLARDLALLSPGYYRIDSIHGLDLFPQTYHFETLVRLRRRS